MSISIFKAGQKVWDLLRGPGVIRDVGVDGVFVSFQEHGVIRYTLAGCIGHNLNRSLYFSEPKIDALLSEPFTPKLKKDDHVLLTFKDGAKPLKGYVEYETQDEIKLDLALPRKKVDIRHVYRVGDKVY